MYFVCSMEGGYLFALGTLLSWTISTFILLRLARQVETATLNKAFLFFGIFLQGVAVCIIDGINPLELFTLPTSADWLWLSLSGILGKSLGDYCGFACLKILGARRRSMLTTLTPGFTWIIALIILGEQINLIGLAGMTLTVVCLFFIFNTQKEKQETQQEGFGRYKTGILMGIAGALLTALAFVLAKKGLEGQSSLTPMHATWIRIIAAFAFLLIPDLVTGKKLDFIQATTKSRSLINLMFWGIMFAVILGLSFSLAAINILPVAVAYTIFSLVPLTVMIVEAFRGKEKLPLSKWVLSLLVIVGVLVLIWREQLES